MSTQPLEAAMASTREVLANVRPEQLAQESPCKSWTVGGVVNHLVDGNDFFQAGLAGTPPSEGGVDHSAGDYLTVYDAACQKTVDAFQAEGAMSKMLKLPFGEMPGAALMGLATTDVFVHGWDVARATGQNTDLNPELATQLLAQSRASIQPEFRGPEGAPFGPEQQAPEGAPVADQLAAFLGRAV